MNNKQSQEYKTLAAIAEAKFDLAQEKTRLAETEAKNAYDTLTNSIAGIRSDNAKALKTLEDIKTEGLQEIKEINKAGLTMLDVINQRANAENLRANERAREDAQRFEDRIGNTVNNLHNTVNNLSNTINNLATLLTQNKVDTDQQLSDVRSNADRTKAKVDFLS